MRIISQSISLALVSISLLLSGCSEDSVPAKPVELTFPIEDTSVVTEIHNFALYPWNTNGETHGGIDIVPLYLDLAGTSTMRKVSVIAPADGEVVYYDTALSGAGLKSYFLILQLDTYWHLILNFEPQSADVATNTEQDNSIAVSVGQSVKRGDKIADLVISNVEADRYPHLHFSVFYKDPADTWADLLAANFLVADGSIASPMILDTDLSTPTTFYCPYDYFLGEGKTVLDRAPKLDMMGNTCSCACSYGSTNGDCGVCP